MPLNLPEEHMNFKISNIPGNSVYINYETKIVITSPWKIFRIRSVREKALEAGAVLVRSILEAMAKGISSPAAIAYEVGRPKKEHERRRRGHYQRQCLRTSQPMDVGPN